MDLYPLPADWKEMKIRPYKKDLPYSYTCGVFPTIELMDHCPSAVFRVLLSEKIGKGGDLIRERASKHGIPVVVDDKTIARLSPKENCFAIGVFTKYEQTLNACRNHIVLVNPSDMGNLGTIIRTLTAFGFQDLAIIRPCADVFDPRVIRASMGAAFRIRVSMYDTFEAYQKICGDRDFYPFMLNGRPMEELTFTKTDKPYSLLFGNESSGLPDSFLSLGTPVRITHENTVDSLNLTIAAGIGIHWFTHRKETEQ